MENLYDLIIIGGGPAGSSAAIYAGRARLRTLLLDPAEEAGQITITSQVVNYPGIPEVSGTKLMQDMRRQVRHFGVPVRKEKATSLEKEGKLWKVGTGKGEYKALAVLAATGAKPRAAGFEGEEEFRGHGVGYCATCDGEFFTGLDIFVVGGGFAAAEEAIFLTRYARKVHMIVMLPEFTCSKKIADEVMAHEDIEVHFNTRLVRLSGEGTPNLAEFVDDLTGGSWTYTPPEGETFGTFVFAGYEPVTGYLQGVAALDEFGYVPTDDELMTSADGLYAAGDMRPKALRQLVTAVSDGAVAATNAERYVAELKAAEGIEVLPPEEAEGKTNEAPPELAQTPEATVPAGGLITPELRAGLQPVLDRMQGDVTLAVVLESLGDSLGRQMQAFAEEFAAVSGKLAARVLVKGQDVAFEAALGTELFPVLALLRADGTPSGLCFHGVPGGHEFTSFVLGVYNVSGPGQPVEADLAARIAALPERSFKVGVSLTCTMCPDVVAAAGLVAAKSGRVKMEMVDISHFTGFAKANGIMSVPAIVLEDGRVVFGKKDLAGLVAVLEEA